MWWWEVSWWQGLSCGGVRGHSVVPGSFVWWQLVVGIGIVRKCQESWLEESGVTKCLGGRKGYVREAE